MTTQGTLAKEAIYKYPIRPKYLVISKNIGFTKVQRAKLYKIIAKIILYLPLPLDPIINPIINVENRT